MKPGIQKTMKQMLESLLGRVPKGEGDGPKPGGNGGGPGGGGQDGYSVAGDSSNIPAYGPDRLQFSNSQLSSSRGSGLGQKGRSGGQASSAENQIETETHRNPAETTISPEAIPAKYRDAVKRYFTTE